MFLGIHMLGLIPNTRSLLVQRYGENKYKGIFALIAGIGFALMLIARFDSGPIHKDISIFFYQNASGIMLLSLILIISAYLPANHYQKYLQHPMLVGILMWSSTHYLMNIHLHHSMFFFPLSVFAILMFIGLMKRDGLKKNEAK